MAESISLRETPAGRLIENVAKEMEKMNEFRPPAWASFVKTGVHRERPPAQKNWWWTRSASMLRKLALEGPLGVSRLRRIYGGRKGRGHKPEHKYPSSGSVASEILKQLEAAGFVRIEKGKGRVVTEKGKTFLKEMAKPIEKK